MSEQDDAGTVRPGPGWYVIGRPKRDPARVVRGPLSYSEADHAARMHTTRARVMHTPALVNAVKNDGYNVEWYAQAEKPAALKDGGSDE